MNDTPSAPNSATSLESFLESIGISDFTESFSSHGLTDMSVLIDASNDELREIITLVGLNMGDRIRFRRALEQLRSKTETQPGQQRPIISMCEEERTHVERLMVAISATQQKKAVLEDFALCHEEEIQNVKNAIEEHFQEVISDIETAKEEMMASIDDKSRAIGQEFEKVDSHLCALLSTKADCERTLEEMNEWEELAERKTTITNAVSSAQVGPNSSFQVPTIVFTPYQMNSRSYGYTNRALASNELCKTVIGSVATENCISVMQRENTATWLWLGSAKFAVVEFDVSDDENITKDCPRATRRYLFEKTGVEKTQGYTFEEWNAVRVQLYYDKSLFGYVGQSSWITHLDSGIWANNDGLINGWLEREPRKFSLLFRASEDGDSASKYHAKCDGSPSKLIIVEDVDGNKFGAHITNQQYFCFTLYKPGFTSTKGNLRDCGRTNSSFGPKLGDDFCIADKSMSNEHSFFGAPSRGFSFGANLKKSFRVRDYEVFRVD